MDSLLLKTFDYALFNGEESKGSRTLRFVQDGRIGLGMAKLEVSWSVVDGRLAILDVDYKPTCVLRKSDDGVWRGQWLEYERFKVELLEVST
jgi:ketosteroid isomerase-like protein